MKNKNYCLALLAHVDAGKTTLSESILFNTGSIRKAGRVDHRDSFLDMGTEERERGITIFSKQALFSIGEYKYTLIDTPGHTDFSAEAERALSVLDLAVLIISAPDGIHGHDLTLWKLLGMYKIPTLIFVNKTDQPGVDCAKVLQDIRESFGAGCIDFSSLNHAADFDFADNEAKESFLESVAVLDENVTESYLESGDISHDEFTSLFEERKLFPCCFGSALKNEGVDRLLSLISYFSHEHEAADEFGAKVFKVTRDKNGSRLTYIRITGGSLRPKDTVTVNHRNMSDPVTEKINRILLYSGPHSEQTEYAEAGMAVVVDGIESAAAGDTLGNEAIGSEMLMTPLFSSKVYSPDVNDVHKLYSMMKELETEIPEISIGFDEAAGEVSMKLMGEVQTDIIKSVARERFNIDLNFSPASIVYKETIGRPVICAGHFEPLRHYAEVHLLMEPGERGSGIEISSELSEDVLPRHFQRLIRTNIAEKKHKGVLTGAELTDVKISLINARAHEKHTEGGDFREAVYRAIRYGLMKSRETGSCILLEPYYEFELSVPDKNVGRAMNDLSAFGGSFEGPELMNGTAFFSGRAAVSKLRDYAAQVTAYTGGFGHLALSFGGYGECGNTEEIVENTGYEPELDLDNQSGSVFCTHGAGYYVPWYEADSYFHLDIHAEEERLAALLAERYGTDGDDVSNKGYAAGTGENYTVNDKNSIKTKSLAYNDKKQNESSGKTDYLGAGLKADKELEEIFYRSLGGNRGKNQERSAERAGRNGYAVRRSMPQTDTVQHVEIRPARKQYLLVDGYNIIFAWDELRELAALNIDAARAALQDVLADYQGFKGMTLILVFDAYKVKGNHGSVEKYHNIYVVYTKEAQTADAYIEATVHEIGKRERVTVATSDGLEQTIVFGEGAARMSARELYNEIMSTKADIRRDFLAKTSKLENGIGLKQQ